MPWPAPGGAFSGGRLDMLALRGFQGSFTCLVHVSLFFHLECKRKLKLIKPIELNIPNSIVNKNYFIIKHNTIGTKNVRAWKYFKAVDKTGGSPRNYLQRRLAKLIEAGNFFLSAHLEVDRHW